MEPLQSERMDALLATLSDGRRRQVLGLVRNRRDHLSVEELVSALVDGSSDEGPSRSAIETRLQHVDLPKLEGAGLISYDPEAGTVAAAEGLEEAQPLLDALEDIEAEPDDVGPNFPVGPTIRTQQTVARFYLESMERQIEQLQG